MKPVSPSEKTTTARLRADRSKYGATASCLRLLRSLAVRVPRRRGGGSSIPTVCVRASRKSARSVSGKSSGNARSVSDSSPTGISGIRSRMRSASVRARASRVGAPGRDAASIERETSNTNAISTPAFS